MAEIHPTATLTPSKLDLVHAWIGRQRWYAAKGTVPALRKVTSFRFDDPAGLVGVETIILADDSGPAPVLYQVPLTYRGTPLAGAEHALVGTLEHSVLGTRWVYDAPHDPVYAATLLACLQGQAWASSATATDVPDERIVGQRHPAWTHTAEVLAATVLSGEQSNTSIVLQCALEDGTARPLICKVFRTLQPGANPDIELQGALRTAHCDRVPEVVGHLSGQWPVDEDGRPAADGVEAATGDLAFAQEFLPGTEDAWRVAIRAVAGGREFTAEAAGIGRATAAVHRALAEVLDTPAATEDTVHALVSQMRHRHVLAMNEAPALAAYEQQIRAIYDAAEAAPWPPMQRIHGDYHLGQVLHSAERGWILLDFEGEPMRALAQRREPDQWIRDVAGMLRSFDYAGGAHEQANPGSSARAWVEDCRRAFLAGYAQESGTDPRSLGPLLAAFEVDKMLYEVVYDARNRPTWLAIPLSAIGRLVSAPDHVPTKEDTP